MTIGWYTTDGKDHYFGGQKGECGQWQSVCKGAETFDDVDGQKTAATNVCRRCEHIMYWQENLAPIKE